ncbi:MAG TPA: IclR family transcriptional regulator [Firmicutes bacterium]|nr:IclR family transcriptional regulator [Bacillota bacterium]
MSLAQTALANQASTSSNKLQRKEPKYLVQSVDRALCILSAFSDGAQELSINDLSRRLGLCKSTIHRLITTLEYRGFIEQNPDNGKYRLGLRLYELGAMTIVARSLVAEAEPYLKQVVNLYGETASVSVLDGVETVIVEKFESSAAIRLTSQIGRRSPIHASASGKVILAFQPERVQDDILARAPLTRYTSRTITEPNALKAHLEVVRAQGYSVDAEEYQEDLICVGAPIFAHTGEAIAAITVSGPSNRMRHKGIETIAASLVQAGLEISRRLGYNVVSHNASHRGGEPQVTIS